jgi:O-antigen ligase
MERLTFSTTRTATPSLGGPPPPDAAAQPETVSVTPRTPARDWAFTWTLLFTAILFLRPQDVVPPLTLLHLAEVSALAGLTALAVSRLSRRQPITRMTPELAGVLAFGALILVTAPFSIWFGGSLSVFTELYAKVILVYLLAVNVIDSPDRLDRLVWVLVLALGYIGFRAILDYALGLNMVGHGTRVRGAVGGILGNPNDLALNMVAFVPLAVTIALQRVSTFKRLVAAACALFMVGAVVASGSRGGFLGFVMMLVVFAAMIVPRRPGLVVAGALAILCVLPVLPAEYWHRLASITDSSKDDFGSTEARRTLLSESWRAFVENPLTGVGAGEFKDWDPNGREQAWHESHNVVLQVAAELGIFGVVLFLFLVGRGFAAVYQARRVIQRARRSRRVRVGAGRKDVPAPRLEPGELDRLDAHTAAMAASLAGWFVCALFGSVAYNWTFYYLLALAATPREILRDRLPAVHRVRGRQPHVVAEATTA